MRGKTNIGGGGIAINATVEQKTIKSGNIIAGDFVEYYSEPEYLDQTTVVNFIFDFGDYLIARPGNGSYITAFKDGEQVDTYAEYNCYYVDKCGDYIIFFDHMQGIIGVLSIVNDRFNLVSTLNINLAYDNNNKYAIAGGGGKVCVIKENENSSPYYPTVVICDISNSGILSNFHVSNPAEAHREVIAAQFYNGYFYVMMNGNGGYYHSYKLEIDAQNEVTIGPSIGEGFIKNAGFKIVYKKGAIFGYAYHDGTSSSSGTTNDGYLVLRNVATGNTISKKIANYGEVLSIISDGYMINSKRALISGAYVTKWFVLCRFNENTFEITELDTVEAPSPNYIDKMIDYNLAGVKNNTIYVQYEVDTYISPNNLYLFEIINGNTVQDFSDHQYVKTYQNNNPIGVAKDSGTAGDTIDVYIPAASS